MDDINPEFYNEKARTLLTNSKETRSMSDHIRAKTSEKEETINYIFQ